MLLLVLGPVDSFSHGLGKCPVVLSFPWFTWSLFFFLFLLLRRTISFFRSFYINDFIFLPASSIVTSHRCRLVTLFGRSPSSWYTALKTWVIRVAWTTNWVSFVVHAKILLLLFLFLNLPLHFCQLFLQSFGLCFWGRWYFLSSHFFSNILTKDVSKRII